jgi:hypothetical protein
MNGSRFSRIMGGAVLVILVAAVGVGCVAEDDSVVVSRFDRTSGPTSAQGNPGSSMTELTCPTVTDSNDSWPAGVPNGVPLPSGGSIDSSTSANGVQRVQFEVAMSFGDAVRFYLAQLPRHGFVLGAGDSEAAEADIPFRNHTRELSLKLGGLADPCQTEGILIIGPETP